MEWLEIILSILSGLVVVIPLVLKLIKYVQIAVKEKNWKDLLSLVTKLMEEAESKFTTGVERKDYVMIAVKASADTINYEIDMNVVSELIDSLCSMSKIVNAPKVEAEVVEKNKE